MHFGINLTYTEAGLNQFIDATKLTGYIFLHLYTFSGYSSLVMTLCPTYFGIHLF